MGIIRACLRRTGAKRLCQLAIAQREQISQRSVDGHWRRNDACRPPARIAARSRAKNGKSGRLPVAIENRHGADLAITALAGVAREHTPRRPTTPEPVRAADPR